MRRRASGGRDSARPTEQAINAQSKEGPAERATLLDATLHPDSRHNVATENNPGEQVFVQKENGAHDLGRDVRPM